MDFDEIKLAFEEVSTLNDCEKVLKVTGGVPWQVKKLISFTLSIDDYEEAELRTILRSSWQFERNEIVNEIWSYHLICGLLCFVNHSRWKRIWQEVFNSW